MYLQESERKHQARYWEYWMNENITTCEYKVHAIESNSAGNIPWK